MKINPKPMNTGWLGRAGLPVYMLRHVQDMMSASVHSDSAQQVIKIDLTDHTVGEGMGWALLNQCRQSITGNENGVYFLDDSEESTFALVHIKYILTVSIKYTVIK